MELRFRMAPLAAGDVMLVTALDSGAIEDLPAWCRLTRHRLINAEHPRYWIARREG